MEGWKFTKANGTDHYSGKVNYRKYIGKELIHPCPNTSSKNACGEGFHLGKTLRGAGEYGVPDAIFRCSYTRKDVLGEDKHKVRVSRLKVLSEEPVWKGYGPWGKQYLSFLDSLKDIKWFENVGKPYKKPEWAKKMKMVDSWAVAWDAAGAVAWDAAWDAAGDAAGGAAETMGGIKDGYFSKLMEVYRAGHYPCSFDGETLVIF